jgi:hypothetical protein
MNIYHIQLFFFVATPVTLSFPFLRICHSVLLHWHMPIVTLRNSSDTTRARLHVDAALSSIDTCHAPAILTQVGSQQVRRDNLHMDLYIRTATTLGP